jgi:hypothetical protein
VQRIKKIGYFNDIIDIASTNIFLFLFMGVNYEKAKERKEKSAKG